jgi:transcriptional regulator with XRE-family HTH domain
MRFGGEKLTLREARKRRGLAQCELGRRLKVTQSAIARWETGDTRPCRKYWKDMSRILGVPVEEIDELKEKAK